jgi:hypothetical protein
MARQARQEGQRIFPLAFHVDYWNYLGWSDPFSDAAYSRRQKTYARKLSVNVYTPQMVVNGTTVFVGSDAGKARANIHRALNRPATVGLALRAETVAGRLVVHYKVSKVPGKAVLHVALAEWGLVTEVVRGENSGRTLSHDNVVRWFETVSLDADKPMPIRVTLPDVNTAMSAVIGYVQDTTSMAILGASMVNLIR